MGERVYWEIMKLKKAKVKSHLWAILPGRERRHLRAVR
jgi:hypothetical protein